MQNPQDVQLAADALLMELPVHHFRGNDKVTGLVLGTGLSHIARSLDNSKDGVRIPFSSLPGFPQSSVESHEGAFVFGHFGNAPVLAQLGRCHLYEGRNPAEICMGVRIMARLGIKTLIITNAAGALNPLFEMGGIMRMADMINFTGVSSLTGPNCDAWGERFPDMSVPFDKNLGKLADATAQAMGIRLEKGVYIGVHGPEMETPAETRMYRQWGADAIGMSTVLEVAAARHMGMRVLGFSCLTNRNLPDCPAPAPLAEIIAVAKESGKTLGRLVEAICRSL